MRVASILQNKVVLKSLEKISEHGTSFAAATSLALSLTLRPLAIHSTPDVEQENKQYAMSNSICSGLMKFAMVESVALPIEHAIKKIDSNKSLYLSFKTLNNLNPRSYKFLTQFMKLGVGLLTAIPKSFLTVALIPIVMDKIFNNKSNKNSLQQPAKTPTFTGLEKQIAGIINLPKVQSFANKYHIYDNDIAKHTTAATDILLTATSAYQTKKSKEIKQNRKNPLILNNWISTGITLALGYLTDHIAKNKTNNFMQYFKNINANDPKLSKYVEGINILRPALIFATIYYGILPMFSTYIAEKIDKYSKQ